jgi:hypothetical protein
MSLVFLSAVGALCGMVGDPGQPGQERKSDPLGILYALCNIHCTTFTVFLRYGFGSEALGFPGLFALILLFICMAGDPRMMLWLMAFFVALVIQRIITFAMLRRGYELHSMDSGWPLPMNLLPFIKKKTTAIALEAATCFLVGTILVSVSPFIGKYLIVGCFSLIVRTAIEQSILKRRIQRMRDAELEQRWLTERFRARDYDL